MFQQLEYLYEFKIKQSHYSNCILIYHTPLSYMTYE